MFRATIFLIALTLLFPPTPQLTVKSTPPVSEAVTIPLPHPGSAHIIRDKKTVLYCADDSYGLYLVILKGPNSSMDFHYLMPGTLASQPPSQQWFVVCMSVQP